LGVVGDVLTLIDNLLKPSKSPVNDSVNGLAVLVHKEGWLPLLKVLACSSLHELAD